MKARTPVPVGDVALRTIASLLVLLSPCSPALAQSAPQASGTKARLRGLVVVNEKVAWAGGTAGTFLLITDGETWRAGAVPGASVLDFRDFHAVDDRTAYPLSTGEGEQSRIFKTADGGATWATSYVNQDPKGFLDALAFWDGDHGLALGDPVGGRFVTLRKGDGGKTWNRMPIEGMPGALPGEGAFAASGTCLYACRGGRWGPTGSGPARAGTSPPPSRGWSSGNGGHGAGEPSPEGKDRCFCPSRRRKPGDSWSWRGP
jgi:photosystem II stability/assembly factor-like uncharacterized protein